jgi:hypothetical protein
VFDWIVARDPDTASALWREHIRNAAAAALGRPIGDEPETMPASSSSSSGAPDRVDHDTV